MRRNLILSLCIPALIITGCSNPLQEPEVDVTPVVKDKKIVITATFDDPATRVFYEEDPSTNWLSQHWDWEDIIYGFDDNGNSFSLRINRFEEVDGKRIAYLETIEQGIFPDDGFIHMFYCGESVYDDYLRPICDVNFSGPDSRYVNISSGQRYADDDPGNILGILTADADVTQVYNADTETITVNANLVFKNQTAILGIQGIKGLRPGEIIDRLEIEGVPSYAPILVDDNHHVQFSFPSGQSRKVTIDFTPEWASEPNPRYYPMADANGELIFGDNAEDPEGRSLPPLYVAVFPRGREDTDHIVLKARVFRMLDPEDDNPTYYYYTYDLGAREVVAGTYYMISPKEFDAPVGLPVAAVFIDEELQEYSSISAAFAAVNACDSDYAEILLLSNCVADGPLTLNTGNQRVRFDLGGNTLTLNQNYLSVDGDGLELILSDGFIEQASDYPAVSAINGAVHVSDYMSFIQTQGESSASHPLFEANYGEDGFISITIGNFQWSSGPIASGEVYISGGYFSKELQFEPDEDYVVARRENETYPYFVISQPFFESLARTRDGVLKTFSTDEYGREKVFLTRNNLYQDQYGEYAFESPNWVEVIPNSSEHKNLFTGDEETGDFNSVFIFNDGFYSNLSRFEWNGILFNRHVESSPYSYTSIPRFLKCKVGDDQMMNLLIFPDAFSWPSLAGDYPGMFPNGMINQYDLDWDDALTFSAEVAEAFLDAGCVFLPYGNYWTSTYYSYRQFKEYFSITDIISFPEDGYNMSQEHFLHLASYCE